MNIDFLHNQIIRDTVTPKFIESFNENLVPYLISEYGSSLTEIQFYEDHLTSGFRVDGEFHYPLTLVCDGRSFTRWIKWPVANYRNYDKFNPYSYKGQELLEFELLDDVADELKAVIAGRPIYADQTAMPVVLASSVGDKTFLAGKFSQGFVDALARAVTDAIELEFGISGLAESGVVLEVRFMPGTFMEHVVENSTYRRILIKARGCAPRDLWIKWTRLDGRGTYTVSDNADTDEIVFEIADEVPGKIREKEYRYLATESVEKYQAAMSRKGMTEWREMMRRVIRRGEVDKLDTVPKMAITAPAEDMEELVETVPVITEVQSAPTPSTPDDDTDALKALLASLENQDDEVESAEEEEDDLSDLLKTAIGLTVAPAPYASDEDTEEDELEYEESEDDEDGDFEVEEAAEPEEPEDTPVRVVAEDDARLELERKIRRELEEELRRKHEEAEELRARLEAQLRAEIREKELMAEAARAAIQEQQRLAKEREEAEARAREEADRRRAEEERAKEEARIAKERAEEEARIRAELEAKEKARQEAEAAAEAAKGAAPDVKYVSKVARLIFKGSVDSSITKRIHEIILATIKYYHKEDVYIKIKATIPDYNSVNLEFVKIPENEIPLLVNIIKVLGRSDLGITRATLD